MQKQPRAEVKYPFTYSSTACLIPPPPHSFLPSASTCTSFPTLLLAEGLAYSPTKQVHGAPTSLRAFWVF